MSVKSFTSTPQNYSPNVLSKNTSSSSKMYNNKLGLSWAKLSLAGAKVHLLSKARMSLSIVKSKDFEVN